MTHRGRGRAHWLPLRKQHSPRTPSSPQLPVYAYRRQILQHVHANTLTLIQGETGCGKSIGVPQIILDDAKAHGKQVCILVAKPRNDQARSLATYVASLRGSSVGSDVSYIVDSTLHPFKSLHSELIYVTSSKLFELFLFSNEVWQKMTHLVLDDVDIRTIAHDLLSLLVKLIFLDGHSAPVTRNKKIVLMTEMFNRSSFEDYFAFLIEKNVYKPIFIKNKRVPPKVIHLDELKEELPTLSASAISLVDKLEGSLVTGKNVPALMLDLIGEIVVSQACAGDVFLIFLPGRREMYRLKDALEKLISCTNHLVFKMQLLDQDLTCSEQTERHYSGSAKTDIIISTNLRAKSVAISKVNYLIDLGIERLCYFDKKQGINKLVMGWTSRTLLRQRAMQVSCDVILRLFTRHTYESFEEEGTPEIRRSCLSLTILKLKTKMCTFGSAADLFEQLLDPPSLDSVNAGVKMLSDYGAIEGLSIDKFSLTQLGRLTVALEVDIHISRLIMLGLLLCCSVECVIIAAGVMLPADLFDTPHLQSGLRENFRSIEQELHYFEGKRFYGNDKCNDMIIFCNVYRQWLSMDSWEKQWINETCINKSSLHLLVEKVQLLSSRLAVFLEDEMLVTAMGSEYQKLMELQRGHSSLSRERRYIFCDDVTAVLLSITGAFNTNIFFGSVQNTILADNELKEISTAGLNPQNTFKLSNVPPKVLDNSESFNEALQGLGPISKVLLLQDSACAFVECCRSPTEEVTEHIPQQPPIAAQRAYFLACHESRGLLKLSMRIDSKIERLCVGRISRNREVFWSTYLKGKRYGASFKGHSSLPQCGFGYQSQETQLFVAATAQFIAAENTKVYLSASTLIPMENYFAVTALLLFRPFQVYLIQTDLAEKFVYSLQYGPWNFQFFPQYILVDQLHLIEKVRTKFTRRLVEGQLCEGCIVEETLHLMTWIASQTHCEPHQNLPVGGSWKEYPSFKLVDRDQNAAAWKLNMISACSSKDDLPANYNVQETEGNCLLQSFRTVEPDLTQCHVEEWLSGNKDLNQVFYSLLERVMADPGQKEKSCCVLKTMHKRCEELVPKKRRAQIESWYHQLCNPVQLDALYRNAMTIPQTLNLPIQQHKSMQGNHKMLQCTRDYHVPSSSKTMNLTCDQINRLKRKLACKPNQVKILLPKCGSLTDNIVIFGHPANVEAAMKWVEIVACRSSHKVLWDKSINETYFVPERLTSQIQCVKLSEGERISFGGTYKGFLQFFVDGCSNGSIPASLLEVGLDFKRISGNIRSCLARIDSSWEVAIQARLGRVIFNCSQDKETILPFDCKQSLGVLLNAFKANTFCKRRFSDTLTKTDFFLIKACLKLFKPVSVRREKKITIFLEDLAGFAGLHDGKKITIEELAERPGCFQLLKVQHKERLAVFDLVHLRMGHVKSDIRLSVQGLKNEHIEDCYRDFVSKIRLDGVKLEFPRSSFDVRHLRIKHTEDYMYENFLVSMNEITEMEGRAYLQKYEVEVSPIISGKSRIPFQEVIENLDTILPTIVMQAQTLIFQLLLNQPSSCISVLVLAIFCLWKAGRTEPSYLESAFHHHIMKDQKSVSNQERDLHASLGIDIAHLVDIIWQVDGLDFDGIGLSVSVLSFLFKSLQSMKFPLMESTGKRAQEIISRQGFPPRIAIAYASLFKCHCLKYDTWVTILGRHFSMLSLEEPMHTTELCHMTLNSLNLNNYNPSHSLDFCFQSILFALGRLWATKNHAGFLRLNAFALEKMQNCSTMSNILLMFVSKIFGKDPSEAALFVATLASCYVIGLARKDMVTHEYFTSMIMLLKIIRDLKITITEDCRNLALNILLSLEDRNNQVQEIEKKVFEVFEIDVTIFRHCHYQKILSKYLPLKAFHLKELEKRGLTSEFCQMMELKSWLPGRHVVSSWLIPGVNRQGSALIGSPGIFIPARDPSGQITGAQIKVDDPSSGKYKWLSSKNVFEGGRGPNIDDEWPLFCCTFLFRNYSTLCMCEGGLKAHVLSFLGRLPVIGASSAAFTRSKKLLEKYLAVLNPGRIIFFPDAGSQCNDQVMRCYLQTFRLLREFGYFFLIAWWGQVNKAEHEDIDDLLCHEIREHNIPLLSPLKFWHILHPSLKRKLANEFPEYSGSSSTLELENNEKFIDQDNIEIIKCSCLQTKQNDAFNSGYLISIPKKIMKTMPPPPNDLVTPSSMPEFTVEVRTVNLNDNDTTDLCIDWVLQDNLLPTAFLGLFCQYDTQCNLCLLGISFHQRCVLILTPSSLDPGFVNRKLQDLLSGADVVKAGMDIDKDALHLYHFLHLRTNNCIKLSLPSSNQRHKLKLLEMFRALFGWEWCEKAKLKNGTWSVNSITIEQIKFGALSAWSCHLIWAQLRQQANYQVKGFCIDVLHHQLIDYFQRSMNNVSALSQQNETSFELAGATVEIQEGFLILNPAIAQSKVLKSKSMVEMRFNDGRETEEYTVKRACEKNLLLQKCRERLQLPDVDISTISKLIVNNSNCIDMQKQKVEDAVHSLLCEPAACPLHILMALGCIKEANRNFNDRTPWLLPRGIMLNRNQIEALRMMLSSPLCAVIGPPGTGKTRLIAGVAKLWEETTPQGLMLLCAAQQNVAVRHMAETMVKSNVQGVLLLISHEYYTVWRQEEYKHIQEHIVISGPASAGRMKAWSACNKMANPRILLCTLALIGSSSFYTCMKKCSITDMIIDESSQAPEETLIPTLICLPNLQRLSVVGDPCQLPPFGNLVQSIFDLVSQNCEMLNLWLQYRMPHFVADFVSREFYRGMLSSAPQVFAGSHDPSILWVDIIGSPKMAVGSTSLCNEYEAEAIVKLCKMYTKAVGEVLSPSLLARSSSMTSTLTSVSTSASSLLSQSSPAVSTSLSSSPSSSTLSVSLNKSTAKLVVLTLYEAQRLLISKLLLDNNVEAVSVHNVDSFQGQEAEIIVVSLVVGARMSPFASDRRRACVLLSRAKCMLYIFGNFKAIKACMDDKATGKPIIWKSLALQCEKHNWVAGAETICRPSTMFCESGS